jgi:hypothetical protein
MSRLCCPHCGLRFGAAVHLSACPECGQGTLVVDDRESLVGLRLFDPQDVVDTLPEALSVSFPKPKGADARGPVVLLNDGSASLTRARHE